LPNYIWLFLFGYGLVGAAQGFLFVPILPEIIDAYCEKYDLVDTEDEQAEEDVSDLASGLYGTMYYSGMIISPITGSLVYQHFGSFNKTCDVFGMLALAYTLLYLVFNVLPDRKSLWNNKSDKYS
jgi:MFS family permease